MDIKNFLGAINSDFYSGVPDSLLKPLCSYLIDKYGNNSPHHIVAANEGNAVALAAGYYLATKKIPLVYLQNSGEGNIINPIASLLSEEIYSRPSMFVIGWRGEPGLKDEPQHICQGKVTLKLLEVMGIDYFILKQNTELYELKNVMKKFNQSLSVGKQVAFVVSKNALTYDKKISYSNKFIMCREDALEKIIEVAENDIIISTTGKISRELFEIREKNNQSHERDFLTVGSMGHTSSIALGIALQKPEKRIWCVDGDGSILMHMGALAVIGANNPKNFIHIALNNEAHESVGGMPTSASSVKLFEVAKACNYSYVASADSFEKVDSELNYIKFHNQLSFLEIKVALGSRKNLGRPTTSPIENKINFMEFISK